MVLEELESSTPFLDIERKVRKSLKWTSIWRKSNGQFKRVGIRPPCGDVAPSLDTGAWALVHYWQPFFAKLFVNLTWAMAYISIFVPRAVAGDSTNITGLEEFVERFFKQVYNELGPDGVLYSCWRLAPVLFQDFFYRSLSGVTLCLHSMRPLH